MGVHALAQSRGRRYCAYIQRANEELITSKFFNGIEVVLTLHQQAQVGLQNVAIGDTTDTYREFAVNAIADTQAVHILTNQCQSGIEGEVVGQRF